MIRRHSILYAFLVFLVIVLSACQPAAAGLLTVEDAWVRAAPAGQNSAIYFVIDNRMASSDALLSAECDKAAVVEVHMSKMDASGKMTMEHQDSVLLPAGEQVTFAPGGLHVMLMNLQEDLTAGQELTFVLYFENSDPVTITAEVRES